MSNKVFYSIIAILTVGFLGLFINSYAKQPPEKILGTEHADKGRQHIAEGTPMTYSTNPPSSGNHYPQPAPKGVYDQEIPDGTLVHSLEHGYVLVAYKPDLPAQQIQKLNGLFAKPYSNQKFIPSKAIVVPRANNPAPISLASWRWTLNLNSFDENDLMQFYLQHVSKSPEPAAS